MKITEKMIMAGAEALFAAEMGYGAENNLVEIGMPRLTKAYREKAQTVLVAANLVDRRIEGYEYSVRPGKLGGWVWSLGKEGGTLVGTGATPSYDDAWETVYSLAEAQ